MEGNEIEDRGGGRFETVDFARRYSALDQYVMGVRAPEEVPPFFYRRSAPDDFRPEPRATGPPPRPRRASASRASRRDVRIEDVIAALGPRVPDHTRAPRLMRQAFVLVGDALAPATETRRRAVARIRARFEEEYRPRDRRARQPSTRPSLTGVPFRARRGTLDTPPRRTPLHRKMTLPSAFNCKARRHGACFIQ